MIEQKETRIVKAWIDKRDNVYVCTNVLDGYYRMIHDKVLIDLIDQPFKKKLDWKEQGYVI